MPTLEHSTPSSKENKPKKSPEEFQKEQIVRLEDEYQRTLSTFGSEIRPEKERLVNDVFTTLRTRLTQQQGFPFSLREQAILKLKLARYAQREDSIDLNTLFDALIETPKFLKDEKGGLHKLFEIHQAKTLQTIAEKRKQRAEMGDKEAFNPWENLFTTISGNYYVARLLNMPHLEKESEYMNHCVGTSDSYINRIKKGEIEILSFRKVPEINPHTHKLEGDEPVITIEYNLKTNTIEQMKKKDDEFLTPNDPYFADVIDALKQLRMMPTDKGTLHDFKKIQPSELIHIPVKPDHLITEHGEVYFNDYDETTHGFILKIGDVDISPRTPKNEAQKLLKIVKHIDVTPDQIAYNPQEMNDTTKVYVGNLEPGIFTTIAHYPNLHIFSSFPEDEIRQESLHVDIKTPEEWEQALKAKGVNISDFAKDILYHKDFQTLTQPEDINLVRLTVNDLGFPNGATTKEIFDKAKELGLELCPPEVGPQKRLNDVDQPLYDWYRIAMKPITDRDGDPRVVDVGRSVDGLWLDDGWAGPGGRWNPDVKFVFRLSKSEA